MTYQIISAVLMILSVGIILFLIGRKVPNSMKNLGSKNENNENFNSQSGGKGSDYKSKLKKFLEKLLRKIKILILKTDAKIMQIIKKLQNKDVSSSENVLTKLDEYPEEQEKAKDDELKKETDENTSKGKKTSLFKKINFSKFRKKPDISEKIEEEENRYNSQETEAEDPEANKEPILKRMSEIRKKLTKIPKAPPPKEEKEDQGFEEYEKEVDKEATIKTSQKAKKSKPKKEISFPKRKMDLAETRRVMFERQEETIIKKISANPKDDKAYVELGKLYLKVENLEDAKASFNQAIKLNRGNYEAKKLLRDVSSMG